MQLVVPLALFFVVLTVRVHAQDVEDKEKKCTKYDTCGPYCTGGNSFRGVVITDMRAFCEMRGFKRSVFGNGPGDLVAYCGKEDRGHGYRFTCCK